MSGPAAAVRRRRTPGPLRVAVTGGATGLGAALLEQLAVRTDLAALVGVDSAPGRVDGVVWRCPRPGDPAALTSALAGVTTVVHLAMSYDVLAEPAGRSALNVAGTALLLEAARAAGVRRVVLLSSVDVYGPQPGGALPVPADAPLLAAADGSLTGDLVQLERLADQAGRTGLQVAVLRAAAVVGGRLGSAYDGSLVHGLAASRLLAVRGVEPLWQLCHADDLLFALELAAVTSLAGPLPVACEGWLAQREVELLAGRRRLELPAAVAVSTAERLHRVGATGAPHEVDRLLHPVVVEASALRAAGWKPSWTNESALTGHLETRAAGGGRGGYTAAGATAAGATVALLGTAALVRRARARRGR